MDRLRDIKIVFLIAVAALTGTITINAAAAEYPAPLQQQKDGIPVDAIQCNAPRDLYIKNSATPVCISASTYDSLLERGLDLALHESFARTIYTITDAGPPEVQRVVEETIRMYDGDKENAFADITALAGNPILHYPFVLDPDTKTVVAHGAIQARVGTPSQIILDGYADKPYDIILEELQNSDGTWVDYVFLDPTTNENGLKRSWFVLHDGYIFGAGFYHSIEEKMNRVIDDAIALYEADGGFDGINALRANPNAHYPLVIDPVANILVAHGVFAEWVGATPFPDDVPFAEIADALANGSGVVRYIQFTNPVTGADDQKVVLIRLHDGYLFLAGYYYQASEKVISVVENTIRMYESDGENTFASINAQAVLDPHYPFVLDPDTQTVVAHGAFPEERVNTKSIILSQGNFTDKTPDEILAELQGGKGTWVEYAYNVPGTDFVEKKRSYLQMHDGYIFGSGYYFSVFTVISP